MEKIKFRITILIIALIAIITVSLHINGKLIGYFQAKPLSDEKVEFSYSEIPLWDEETPYTVINNNIPCFTKDETKEKSKEEYGDIDYLGRCTPSTAILHKSLMPDKERESIGMIKPSGWPSKTIKFDFIEDKYLFNRCHVIGYQLTGENANPKNLITGTRYMNVEGMLPFENKVASYLRKTNNHVLYRVSPIFYENELLARGVLMEAYSIEDKGKGICFNVFCYNVQPNVIMNYATSEAKALN